MSIAVLIIFPISCIHISRVLVNMKKEKLDLWRFCCFSVTSYFPYIQILPHSVVFTILQTCIGKLYVNYTCCLKTENDYNKWSRFDEISLIYRQYIFAVVSEMRYMISLSARTISKMIPGYWSRNRQLILESIYIWNEGNNKTWHLVWFIKGILNCELK